MTIHTFDPLEDSRWPAFVDSHPAASIFHTRGWIEALRRTYAYEPVVYTTSAPSETLANAVLLCRVRSWLTGRRMVSVPFADHCELLVERVADRPELLGALQAAVDSERWNYIELRPATLDSAPGPAFEKASEFHSHTLDLRPPLEELFSGSHKSTIQRKILRARREGLCYEEGTSEGVLSRFYHLQLLTRRRHRLPPQPVSWFRNLIGCLGDRVKIRVASKDGLPLASILTLQYRDTLVYKYGCSDASVHNLGGMPFLLWRAIQEAKALGLRTLDLGRSDLSNVGLTTFKERWGATPSTLTYLRCPAGRRSRSLGGVTLRLPKALIAHMPDRVFATAGRLIYRHLG